MRIEEGKLVELALRAIEDAAKEAMKRPVQRSFGLRLALAYLASRQECERWPFDGFWRYMVHDDPKGRAANVTANLNGIYAQLGLKKRI